MTSAFVPLITLGLAAAVGAVVALLRAASPEDGVARQVTLAVLALILLAVTAGVGYLIWFFHQFATNFTF